MSQDIRQLVGTNVRRCRTKIGITQAELAQRLGVDRAYVSGLELGKRNPTVLTLREVAEALGVSVARLVAD